MNLYFHSAPVKKRRVTVAAVVTETGVIRIGIAKCSALDQFSRKKGRSIATIRANSRGVYEVYPTSVVPEGTSIGHWFKDKAQHIAEAVLKDNISPLPIKALPLLPMKNPRPKPVTQAE
jgi:hypothetical protein